MQSSVLNVFLLVLVGDGDLLSSGFEVDSNSLPESIILGRERVVEHVCDIVLAAESSSVSRLSRSEIKSAKLLTASK